MSFGYNYQANLFNGKADGVDRVQMARFGEIQHMPMINLS